MFFTVNSNEEISMKKTFLTCLAVVALFAVATSATAITPVSSTAVADISPAFSIDRFFNGRLIDEHGAAAVAH